MNSKEPDDINDKGLDDAMIPFSGSVGFSIGTRKLYSEKSYLIPGVSKEKYDKDVEQARKEGFDEGARRCFEDIYNTRKISNSFLEDEYKEWREEVKERETHGL